MKKYLLLIPFVILVLSAKGFFDYILNKDVPVSVLDKMQASGRSGRFYLILRDDQNRIFDVLVSPATYWKAEKGGKITLRLCEMDIGQTTRKNILYFFIPIISISSSIVIMVFIIFSKYDHSRHTNK